SISKDDSLRQRKERLYFWYNGDRVATTEAVMPERRGGGVVGETRGGDEAVESGYSVS
ncbi:hypothetical protein BgiBS90_016957, partial [Biomphalaria glabrata]